MRLWAQLNGLRRRQVGLLLVLMVLASLAEVLSIGAVLPFLAVLTAPERLLAHPWTGALLGLLGLDAKASLVLVLAAVFGVMALLAGGLRLLLLWATTRVSFQVGAELSQKIYQRTLYQPYEVHIGRNSSEVISGITVKANELIYSGMLPALNIASSAILIVSILLVLCAIDPVTALGMLCGFGLIYGLIARLTRRQLASNGQKTAQAANALVKILQEGLGGIRDILLDGTQRRFFDLYRQTDEVLRKSQASSHFLGASPRFAIEAIGMMLIALVAYAMSLQPGGIESVIPVLGAFALSAQRMLPAVQQIYAGWATLQGGHASVQDALALLEEPLRAAQPDTGHVPLQFAHTIELRDVSLCYGASQVLALDHLSLAIEKGSRTGFIGETGSGKSTLMDVIMGLITPSRGALHVDGQPMSAATARAWQQHVAHVPQNIFLADASVAENIAFGASFDEIDMQRVRAAAQKAQIAGLIESWPEQYQTTVGERGVRLSGGQRQRIGIARALYKRADVIIFDEATSALDDETEREVIASIESLSRELTILMVAHRITTLRSCDRIFQLDNGRIAREVTFAELMDETLRNETLRTQFHRGRQDEGQ